MPVGGRSPVGGQQTGEGDVRPDAAHVTRRDVVVHDVRPGDAVSTCHRHAPTGTHEILLRLLAVFDSAGSYGGLSDQGPSNLMSTGMSSEGPTANLFGTLVDFHGLKVLALS